MFEEISAYEEYLFNFGVVEKPQMPKFDVLAYTNNEYINAISECMNAFENVDDEYLLISYLKGD